MDLLLLLSASKSSCYFGVALPIQEVFSPIWITLIWSQNVSCTQIQFQEALSPLLPNLIYWFVYLEFISHLSIKKLVSIKLSSVMLLFDIFFLMQFLADWGEPFGLSSWKKETSMGIWRKTSTGTVGREENIVQYIKGFFENYIF